MLLGRVHGVIERRLLVNFRVDEGVLQHQLPPPFEVDAVNGHGIAGICLIRLAHERLRGWPRWLGTRSENAAHRIAVKWPTADGPRHGVYIVRRDTSSRLNTIVGGRLFPGRHHHAAFTVDESPSGIAISLRADDDTTRVAVRARPADGMPATSVFGTLGAASEFFERGAMGCSPTTVSGRFDRLELRSERWRVEPFAADEVASSWLDDPRRFPRGSVAFDSVLAMRDVEHEWIGHAPLRCE